MLRPRQLVKLVACVPVTATTTSNVLSCKTPADESNSSDDDAFTSSESKHPTCADSGQDRFPGLQLTKFHPSLDQPITARPSQHHGQYVAYAPNALGTVATDSLLRTVDELFVATTIHSAAATTIVQKMSNCTNQVFKVGDAAIFKPQLAARLQQLQETETAEDRAPAGQAPAGQNHTLCAVEQNSSLPRQSTFALSQRQIHSQRFGLYCDEEAVREVTAYTLDRQQSPELCCNVPATAVVEMRISEHAVTTNEKRTLQISDTAHSPSQKNNCTVKIPGQDHVVRTYSTGHDLHLHGTLHAYRSHSGAAEDYGDSMFDVGDVQRIAVLDIRLFNTDRHGGNLLFTQNRRLIPIDHGLCLPDLRSVLRGLVNAEFAWCHWRHARRTTLPQLAKSLQSDVDPLSDARLLRSLGTRESCVATAYLSTIFLQWAQSDKSNRGLTAEKGTSQDPWTLADIAHYLQSPPFGGQDEDAMAPRCSLFALLVASVLESMREVHPTVEQAWMSTTPRDDQRPSTLRSDAAQSYTGLRSEEPRPEDTEVLANAFRAHLNAHGATRPQR
eukprot:INCI20190.1.p1 GENE.INCI20190.1~~INCI20190.1.p1  ORF type:complete len:557 (+),score=59.69 INCI20190.1:100-1770(+)